MSGWISVEDRLPEEFASVLVLFERGGHYRARVTIGHLYKGEWGPVAARKFKITHWHPIPELPDGGRPGPYG